MDGKVVRFPSRHTCMATLPCTMVAKVALHENGLREASRIHASNGKKVPIPSPVQTSPMNGKMVLRVKKTPVIQESERNRNQKRKEEWSGRRGSNPRHQAWEACVLPLNYSRTRLARHLYHSPDANPKRDSALPANPSEVFAPDGDFNSSPACLRRHPIAPHREKFSDSGIFFQSGCILRTGQDWEP